MIIQTFQPNRRQFSRGFSVLHAVIGVLIAGLVSGFVFWVDQRASSYRQLEKAVSGLTALPEVYRSVVGLTGAQAADQLTTPRLERILFGAGLGYSRQGAQYYNALGLPVSLQRIPESSLPEQPLSHILRVAIDQIEADTCQRLLLRVNYVARASGLVALQTSAATYQSFPQVFSDADCVNPARLIFDFKL